MRVCIFGAGAVGGHLAAKLAAAGHAVSVVSRGANLAAMRAGGLTLRHGNEVIRGKIDASGDPAALGPQDAVFVTTKATGLPAFAAGAAPLLGPETPVVFVQNGVPWWYAQGLAKDRPVPPDLSKLDPGGALARAIEPRRVIGAVVYSSNDVVAPGVIENHSVGRNMLVLGEPDDRASDRVSRLRAAVEASGMASPVPGDLRASVWDKLMINFGATLTVLVEEPISVVMNDARLVETRARMMEEGRAICAAHGVDPANAPRRPGGAQASGATPHKPSMLQDYELNRPMEVEAILLAPLAFAVAAGVPVPTLSAIAALISWRAARKGLFSP